MTDLQWSLAVVGVVAVAGVFVFNLAQERRLRRDAERTFRSQHADVLLEPTGGEAPPAAVDSDAGEASPTHVEPVLEPAGTPAPPDAIDETIDYVVEMEGAEPVAYEAISAALVQHRPTGKRVRWLGRPYGGDDWVEIDSRTAVYGALRVGLQLADRTGPVAEAELGAFCGAAAQVAAELGLVPSAPSREEALDLARRLDEFCARFDLVIGVNVVAADGRAIEGTRVAELAHEAGMTFSRQGTFELHDPAGGVLFSLSNREPRPFHGPTGSGLSTRGVTFLLDVPRVADGLEAFDRMTRLAVRFAESLGATVVDDNLAPLSPNGIATIRSQLEKIFEALDAHGYTAGSPIALRLFSEPSAHA
jgi:FtsZ-interacting cell division protein ZipA